MPTTMPRGAPASAAVIANAALFTEVYRGDGAFFDLLSEPPKTQGMIERMIREGRDFEESTAKGYPVVRITDLATTDGDEVSVDLVHAKNIKPVMGDKEVKGRRGTTTFASQKLGINQFVFPWSGGGKMAQKRTKWKLPALGRAQAARSAKDYLRQLKLVHMAGARGYDDKDDWVIPLASDPDFSETIINPVLAPTQNRYLVAGGAADIEAMDTTHFMKLEDISRLKAFNAESRNPVGRVMLPDDPAAETDPLGLLLVDERVWFWLEQYHSGTGKDWQTFLMNARERGAKNPLFAGGSAGMWGGVLVKKMPRAIRFGQGQTVTVAQKDVAAYTEATMEVPEFQAGGAALDYSVSRSIYLGSQALAELWGRNNDTGVPTDWYEGYENDGREYVCSLGGIGGCGKLRFRTSDGVDTDHGIIVMDSYAPNPLKVTSLSAPVV